MCDTLWPLAASTARGATLFAKNSDRERNEAQGLELSPRRRGGGPLRLTYLAIPDAPASHACLGSGPCWMWGAEIGANEHGVAIGNEALHAKTPAQRKRALTGMDLVRLGLERAATAAEAVEVITGLLEQYGQGGNCGHLGRFYYDNGFIIADPNEAFVLETQGRWWAVERVKRHRALSNAYSIGKGYDGVSVDFARHAREHHWTGLTGRFDVAKELLDEARDAVSFGRGRCARGNALLDRAAPRLTPSSMMAILRDHGDDPDWSPADTRNRTICMHAAQGPRRSQSVGSMVSELRPGRTVHWVTGTSAPCTSLFKPVLFGVGWPPVGPAPNAWFDHDSLWWRHERLHRTLLHDFTAGLGAIERERDIIEAGFVAHIDASFDGGPEGLHRAVSECWREAEAAESRWLDRLEYLAPQGQTAHRRSWARLNHVAGLPRT